MDTPHIVEPDREKAIRKAIENAAPGDVVILAGKGHEDYQETKTGRFTSMTVKPQAPCCGRFGYGGNG